MNTTLPRPDRSTPPPTDLSTPPTSFAPPSRPERPRLVRPTNGRRLGGVCAGIADKYGWSRTTVRVLAVLSILLPGPQVIAYLIGWIAIPDEADLRSIVDVDIAKASADVRRVVE